MIKDKVFVGVENIAGISYYVVKALRTVGIQAKSFSFSQHPFGYGQDIILKQWGADQGRNFFQKLYNNKYTRKLINPLLRIFYFFSNLNKFNNFIFISRYTFFRNNLDLRILKFFGKRIHFHFVGCPERDPTDTINTEQGGFCRACTDEGLKKTCSCTNIALKSKKINVNEKYADIIFAQRDTRGFLSRTNEIHNFYYTTENKSSNYLKKYDDILKVNIAHFPSNKLLKGTKFVETAIEKLDNSNFNYISKRVSNIEILNILESTHILIDQFGSAHGLLTVEAMSRGCVVICRLSEWFKEDYPEIPIISCEPEELKDVLEDLIVNSQKMKEIAEKSLDYFKKYHSLKTVGNYYKRVLNLN